MEVPNQEENNVTTEVDTNTVTLEEAMKLEEELILFEFYKFRAEYGLYHKHFFGLEFDEIMEEYGDKITLQYHHDYYDKTVKEAAEFCKTKFGIDLFDKKY